MNNFGEKVSFICSVADLLRAPYRPNQYKDVMLPLTLLQQLDCVMEPTKDKVFEGNPNPIGASLTNFIKIDFHPNRAGRGAAPTGPYA